MPPLTKNFFSDIQLATPMSDYVGSANKEYENALARRQQNYLRNYKDFNTLQSKLNSLSVLGQDTAIKENAISKFQDELSGVVDKGNYENAATNILKAAGDFQGDEMLKAAMNNYAQRQEYIKGIKKRIGKKSEEGGLTEDQARRAIALSDSQYKGVDKGDDLPLGAYNGYSPDNIYDAYELAKEIGENYEQEADGSIRYKGSLDSPYFLKEGFKRKYKSEKEMANDVRKYLYSNTKYMAGRTSKHRLDNFDRQLNESEILNNYYFVPPDPSKEGDRGMIDTKAFQKDVETLLGKPFEEVSEKEKVQALNVIKFRKDTEKEIEHAASLVSSVYGGVTEFTPIKQMEWNKNWLNLQKKSRENQAFFGERTGIIQLNNIEDFAKIDEQIKEYETLTSQLLQGREYNDLPPAQKQQYDEANAKLNMLAMSKGTVLNSYNRTNGKKIDDYIKKIMNIYDINEEEVPFESIKDFILKGESLPASIMGKEVIVNPKNLGTDELHSMIGERFGKKYKAKDKLSNILNTTKDIISSNASNYVKDNKIGINVSEIFSYNPSGKTTAMKNMMEHMGDMWQTSDNWIVNYQGKPMTKNELELQLNEYGMSLNDFEPTFNPTRNGVNNFAIHLNLKNNLPEELIEKYKDKNLTQIYTLGEPVGANDEMVTMNEIMTMEHLKSEGIIDGTTRLNDFEYPEQHLIDREGKRVRDDYNNFLSATTNAHYKGTKLDALDKLYQNYGSDMAAGFEINTTDPAVMANALNEHFRNKINNNDVVFNQEGIPVAIEAVKLPIGEGGKPELVFLGASIRSNGELMYYGTVSYDRELGKDGEGNPISKRVRNHARTPQDLKNSIHTGNNNLKIE